VSEQQWTCETCKALRLYWRALRWLIASRLIGWAFSLMAGEMSREMVKGFFDLDRGI
jgi:hypothetical protein